MNIYEKISEIRKNIPYIKKTKDLGSGVPYATVKHDEVTAMIRPSLIEYGIVVVPNLIKSEFEQSGNITKTGIAIWRYKGLFKVDFINAEKGAEDMVSLTVEAYADDPGDKAPGQTLSMATKNAMLKMFNVETGENEESRVEGVDEKRALADEHQHWLASLKEFLRMEQYIPAFEQYMEMEESIRTQLYAGAPQNPQNWGPFTHEDKTRLKAADTAHFEHCRQLAELMDQDDPTAFQKAAPEFSELERRRVWGLLPDEAKDRLKSAKEAV